jgi:endo-1,4-beta-xylanase
MLRNNSISCVGYWGMGLLTIGLAVACVVPPEKRPVRVPRRVDLGERSIAKAYAPFFSIGAAIEPSHLKTVRPLLDTQFNRLTCENAMKMRMLQPEKGRFTFENADAIANYARDTGKKMTGHALLWHRETPAWVTAGVTPGSDAAREQMIQALKTHMETVILRYDDVVDNWDVVNEAISDDPHKTFRDIAEGSMWHQYFGGNDDAGREYVYQAFKLAKEVMDANEPGSSEGKLYYNDYNVNLKLTRILDVLKWMEQEKGLKIDGVGMQAHWTLEWPSVPELQRTIDTIVAAGYKVKISELDINLYSDYTAEGVFRPAPEIEFTPEVEMRQAKRYGALFAMFRQNSDHITSVTTWGVADDHTWLVHEPVKGRDNHPLLFGKDLCPKAAVNAILDF